MNHRPRRKEIEFFKTVVRKRVDVARDERQKANEARADLLRQVGLRDGFRCACCGATTHLTLDHIAPVSLGGRTVLVNLQILCMGCNKAKNDRIIDYRGMQS